MGAISIDLRERIVAACDRREETQEEIAKRFDVSLGFVKKLVKQRNKLGHIRPLYDRVGAKRKLTEEKVAELISLVDERPDRTLEELRDLLEVDCTIQTIHNALKREGFSFKKNVTSQRTRS